MRLASLRKCHSTSNATCIRYQGTNPTFKPHPIKYKYLAIEDLLAVQKHEHRMHRFVLLLALVAAPSLAAPSGVLPSAIATYAAPAYVPAVAAVSYAAAPAPLAVAAAPAPQLIAYAAPKVAIAPPLVQTYAAVPLARTEITQHVQYAAKDVVTGYTSQILKPNLGALATPLVTVSKTPVLAAGRTVATYTPTVTKVEPEVTVKKVQVDVPVPKAVVSEIEVRTPVVAPAAVTYTAPVLKLAAYSAPAVEAWPAPAAVETWPAAVPTPSPAPASAAPAAEAWPAPTPTAAEPATTWPEPSPPAAAAE